MHCPPFELDAHHVVCLLLRFRVAQWYSVCRSSTARASPRHDGDLVLPGQSGSNYAYSIQSGYTASCDAYGFYQDTVEANGWSYLHTESNAALTAVQAGYATAYLEGALTNVRIYQSAVNSIPGTFPATNGTIPANVIEWINTQNAWIQEQANDNPGSDYWNQVLAVYAQVQGLWDGYMTVSHTV
jgi:hypothetical protein